MFQIRFIVRVPLIKASEEGQTGVSFKGPLNICQSVSLDLSGQVLSFVRFLTLDPTLIWNTAFINFGDECFVHDWVQNL